MPTKHTRGARRRNCGSFSKHGSQGCSGQLMSLEASMTFDQKVVEATHLRSSLLAEPAADPTAYQAAGRRSVSCSILQVLMQHQQQQLEKKQQQAKPGTRAPAAAAVMWREVSGQVNNRLLSYSPASAFVKHQGSTAAGRHSKVRLLQQ